METYGTKTAEVTDENMKIGEFSDSFLPVVDGVGRVVYSYCDHIARSGHECSAIVPLTDMGYRGNYPFEIIDYFSKSVPGMPQYKVGTPVIDEHYRQHLALTDFDIVHIHTPFIAGEEGIRYAKKHDIPVVATFHSKYYDDFYQLTGSRILAGLSTDIMMAEFFNRCDEVWTLTTRSAETLRSYGCRRNIFILPNGMDLRDVSEDQRNDAVKQFGLRTDVPVLLYVGQINWKKNIGLILDAAKRVKDNGTMFQLVLAGQGPHEEEIRAKAEQLGLANDTVFTGHITHTDLLDGLYKAASLFVFPSDYDTYAMVVREAANAGTPAVCLKGSAAAQDIIHGENGFLCLEDPEDLCRVIEGALKNPEKLRLIGESAKETLPDSWDVIIDRALDRYQYLIEGTHL